MKDNKKIIISSRGYFRKFKLPRKKKKLTKKALLKWRLNNPECVYLDED